MNVKGIVLSSIRAPRLVGSMRLKLNPQLNEQYPVQGGEPIKKVWLLVVQKLLGFSLVLLLQEIPMFPVGL